RINVTRVSTISKREQLRTSSINRMISRIVDLPTELVDSCTIRSAPLPSSESHRDGSRASSQRIVVAEDHHHGFSWVKVLGTDETSLEYVVIDISEMRIRSVLRR